MENVRVSARDPGKLEKCSCAALIMSVSFSSDSQEKTKLKHQNVFGSELR